MEAKVYMMTTSESASCLNKDVIDDACLKSTVETGPSPKLAVVNVEGHCNSRCCYCSAWHFLNSSNVNGEDWEEIFDQLWDLGVRDLILSGGEPLLRKDITELVAYAADSGFTVSLLTNGIVLTSKLMASLAEAGLDYLNLSLDSLEDSTYRKLRGVPLSRIRPALKAMHLLSKQHVPTQFAFTCVVTMINVCEIPSLIEEANAHGIAFMLQPYHYLAHLRVPQLLPNISTVGKLADVMEEVVAMRAAGSRIWNSDHYLSSIAPFMLDREGFGEGPCLAGYQGVNIDVNLDVKPCWYLPPTGNLREAPLKHIWNSVEFHIARQRMRKLDCSRCMLLCHTQEPAGAT